jgi:ATP-dependent helicase/DNAse subunit B
LEVDIGGEKLKVQGYVDRMDRQGSRVIVVDYKSGSTRIEVSEMEAGHNFQMMLYLLAAQQIIADDITWRANTWRTTFDADARGTSPPTPPN